MNGRLEITANGDCLLGGAILHPGQGARQAAGRELAGLLGRARPGDLLVLAGAGLGWHARAALDQVPGLKVLVFEPDAQRRALLAALGPDLGPARVVADLAELEQALGQCLVYGDGARASLYSPPAFGAAEPQLADMARQALESALTRARVDQANRRAKQGLWLESLAQNFKHALKLTDPTRLAGAFAGAPALVVGAGPSLDQSLPLLARQGFGGLVLAAASALGPLAAWGLAPHLALAMEAKDESRQFAGADPGRTILAAASSGHPAHFSSWPGAKCMFHLFPWICELLGQGLALPSGGHVTSAAFSLAVCWGCDPIILVGQDLAFRQGRAHASGRPGGEEEGLPGLVEVPAIGGGSVQTSLVMQGYIGWYQEAAAYLAGRRPSPRIINATAAGARLAGFEHLDLGEALALGNVSRDYLKLLRYQMAGLRPPRAKQVQTRLGLLKAQARRAQAQAGGLAQLLDSWAPETAVGQTLRAMAPSAGPEGAAQALNHLHEALRAMSEALHV